MYTLFLSTYSNFLTVGLLKNGRQVSIHEIDSVKSHSIHLLPTIDLILKDNQITTNDLNEVIVINGPGSFTGVRLGVTVAKTLAYTLKIKIKVITSLDALAVSCDILNRKIVYLNDNKGTYYGIYENNQLIGELNYLATTEFEKLLKKEEHTEICKPILNIENIYLSLLNKNSVNPHEVKATYIKKIEVLNGN